MAIAVNSLPQAAGQDLFFARVDVKLPTNGRFGGSGRIGVTLSQRPDGAWAQTAVPATLDDMLDDVVRRFGLPVPIGDVVYSSPYDAEKAPAAVCRRRRLEALRPRQLQMLC